MQLYTLIFCSIISVTLFIIINCSSRLVQCLRILDVKPQSGVREGGQHGEGKEGGGRKGEGGRQVGGEYGVGESMA